MATPEVIAFVAVVLLSGATGAAFALGSALSKGGFWKRYAYALICGLLTAGHIVQFVTSHCPR